MTLREANRQADLVRDEFTKAGVGDPKISLVDAKNSKLVLTWEHGDRTLSFHLQGNNSTSVQRAPEVVAGFSRATSMFPYPGETLVATIARLRIWLLTGDHSGHYGNDAPTATENAKPAT